MIELRDLEFAYGGSGFRMKVPELSIDSGERVAVIGPSGSGKTTFLHLVAGIASPDAGRISVDDVDVSRLGDAARRRFRIHRIGLVFQEFELLEHLDVLGNILLSYHISGDLRLDRGVRERARRLAEEVGIAELLGRSIRKLSQGERQRVALCRALLPEPSLLLADEPTGNLDPESKGRVLDILASEAARGGATLVVVTHDHGLLDRFGRVVDAAEWSAAGGGGG